jgi:hypothetical protein
MTCIVTGGKEELGISIMNDLLPRLLDILGGKKAIRDLIDSRVGAHWLREKRRGHFGLRYQWTPPYHLPTTKSPNGYVSPSYKFPIYIQLFLFVFFFFIFYPIVPIKYVKETTSGVYMKCYSIKNKLS